MVARELDPCVGFRKTDIVYSEENNGEGHARCLVAFISFKVCIISNEYVIMKYIRQDLGDNREAFTTPLSLGNNRPIFLFITDTEKASKDSSEITEIFKETYKDIEAIKTKVDCVLHKVNGMLITCKSDNHTTLRIGKN